MSKIKTNRFGNPYGGPWANLDARGKGVYCKVEGREIYHVLSYGTLVAIFNLEDRTVTRCWSGYSATTMRHIEAFCDTILPVRVYFPVPFRKAFWESLEVRQPFCYGKAEVNEFYEMAGLRRRAA